VEKGNTFSYAILQMDNVQPSKVLCRSTKSMQIGDKEEDDEYHLKMDIEGMIDTRLEGLTISCEFEKGYYKGVIR